VPWWEEQEMKKAFTLIELVVAIGILAMVLSFASVIFKVSINSQRTAIANAEIMQKLRAITNQLDADFKGLGKDGEIFVAWVASPKPGDNLNKSNAYERFDRIMFFADGDFQSYRANPAIRGNVARICYMLANKDNAKVSNQAPEKRILARTQHILTANPAIPDFLDPNTFVGTDQQWYDWNNLLEYDKTGLEEWKYILWQRKVDMLSVIADVNIGPSAIPPNWKCRGITVNPEDANSIHALMCEGVGEFKVQGWYEATPQGRWVPEVDPDGDGNLTDTHFFLTDPDRVPGVLYPYRVFSDRPFGGVSINNISYPAQLVDEAHFHLIPGLGRALKFTFTLYDSKGVIKDGRTFTHIVYLD